MRNKENNLFEALRIIKDARQTNFKKEYINPWENRELTRGKITHIDYDSKMADVKIGNNTITVPIQKDTFHLIEDIGHTMGATAFIKQNVMVDFSYQTLTPVRQESEEVIVYE